MGWGQNLVYSYLQQKLEKDVSRQVVWVNKRLDTGVDYDLRIDNVYNGQVEAYIEVTASNTRQSHFEMSHHKWNFAKRYGDRFVIFRVQNAGKENMEVDSITNPFRQWKEMNLDLCLSF